MNDALGADVGSFLYDGAVPSDDHSRLPITGRRGLLNSWLGVASPQCSAIVCIFVIKASFDAVPRSLIDAARIDGLAEWRILARRALA